MPPLHLVWTFSHQCNCVAPQICPYCATVLANMNRGSVWVMLFRTVCDCTVFLGKILTLLTMVNLLKVMTNPAKFHSLSSLHSSTLYFLKVGMIWRDLSFYSKHFLFVEKQAYNKEGKKQVHRSLLLHYCIIWFPCPFLKYKFFIIVLKLELIRFLERISGRSCN